MTGLTGEIPPAARNTHYDGDSPTAPGDSQFLGQDSRCCDRQGKRKMRVGIAADHGGFELKEHLLPLLRRWGHEVIDFGAHELNQEDDYPDLVIPLARAVAHGEVARGIAICGSGVGAAITANKVPGVRAALITECYSAHQGVEHDDLNLLCLGGWVTGRALAQDLVSVFLEAQFSGRDRHRRRLDKIARLENAP